jgi:hypothetical protein
LSARGGREEGTDERLKAHLGELVNPKIARHRGRIVKNTGGRPPPCWDNCRRRGGVFALHPLSRCCLVRTRNQHDPVRVFEFMSAHQAVFPVAVMARVLGVSEAGFRFSPPARSSACTRGAP